MSGRSWIHIGAVILIAVAALVIVRVHGARGDDLQADRFGSYTLGLPGN